MAAPRVGRGVLADIPFFLRAMPGGALTDDEDWVDGSTVAEWPVVAVRRKSDLADVTDDWAIDIAPYPIDDPPPATNLPVGSIKHPTTTTGIWRTDDVGTYRLRVRPDTALAYGYYQVGVTYDVGSGAFTEWSDVLLVAPGDVSLGAGWVTYEEVTADFTTTLDEDEVQPIIVRATAWAISHLKNRWGIAEENIDQDAIKECIIARVQARIRTMDLGSSAGPITEMTEGPDRVKFAGTSDSFLESQASIPTSCLDIYGRKHAPGRRRRLGVVTRPVGHTADNHPLLGEPLILAV